MQHLPFVIAVGHSVQQDGREPHFFCHSVFLNQGVCLWFTAPTWLALLLYNLKPFLIFLFAPETYAPVCFLSSYPDFLNS